MQMKTQQVWQYAKQHRIASIAVGHAVVITMLCAVLLGSGFGADIFGASAQSFCSSSDRTYSVAGGDTLGAIAARFQTSWQKLASYNNISNPNLIYIAEHICIPGGGSGGGSSQPIKTTASSGLKGFSNPFPYGQCTWWASQRYFQVTGSFVPWTTNANAWQWVYRAYDFGWHVSSRPVAGSIVVLQPWVEGAYGLGHVAYVESVQPNGSVVASNMNWGLNPWAVTDSSLWPGSGVSFVYR